MVVLFVEIDLAVLIERTMIKAEARNHIKMSFLLSRKKGEKKSKTINIAEKHVDKVESQARTEGSQSKVFGCRSIYQSSVRRAGSLYCGSIYGAPQCPHFLNGDPQSKLGCPFRNSTFLLQFGHLLIV